MTSKLDLYNAALLQIGSRKLASLTENREPRRVLDGVWDRDAYDQWLEAGLWNFAARTVQADYSPSVEPPFGFNRAFDKPTDFVRTMEVATDEFFNNPLLDYTDEAGYWFSNLDTIYVRYVSNDAAYGADLSLWPPSFTKYVETTLAAEVCFRLTQDKVLADAMEKKAAKLLIDAKSKDAMAEPTKFTPAGSWVRSRRGGVLRDRGNRGSLIG